MNVTGEGPRLDRVAFDARFALVVYVRVLSVIFLVSGLRGWALVLGPLAPGGDFLSLPTPLIVAAVFFCVCDLVAAVGLWLLASWGTVVWLIAALAETVLHTVFAKMFGVDILLVLFNVVTVIAYTVLTVLYERQRTD
jgi:hypothetical protein